MKLLIENLRELAAEKPPGFLADCVEHGSLAGPWLIVTGRDYQKLLAKWHDRPDRRRIPRSLLTPPHL